LLVLAFDKHLLHPHTSSVTRYRTEDIYLSCRLQLRTVDDRGFFCVSFNRNRRRTLTPSAFHPPEHYFAEYARTLGLLTSYPGRLTAFHPPEQYFAAVSCIVVSN